mgnify:FL=1
MGAWSTVGERWRTCRVDLHLGEWEVAEWPDTGWCDVKAERGRRGGERGETHESELRVQTDLITN